VGHSCPRRFNTDVARGLCFGDGTQQWLDGAGVLGARWGAGASHRGAPHSPAAPAPLSPCRLLALAEHRWSVVVAGGGDLEPLHGRPRQEERPWGGRRDVFREGYP